MKSYAEQKREDRAKKREQGYVLKQIWVKEKHWDKIKKVVDRFYKLP